MGDRLKGLKGAPKSRAEAAKMPLEKMIGLYGGSLFAELTGFFNAIFAYRNEGYEPVSVEWFEDNVTIGDIMEIGQEVATQNRMEWLIPFFGKLLESLAAPIMGARPLRPPSDPPSPTPPGKKSTMP
jgi:hypothetical protein